MTKEEKRDYNRKWEQDHADYVRGRRKRYNQKNKVQKDTYNKDYRLTVKAKYTTYKSSAKVRNIPFDLSFEEFKEFWKKPCHYCRDPIETIGLDRIHNNKGYTKETIVPCCMTCNYVRLNLFTFEEMLKELGPAIAKIKHSRMAH